MDNDAAVDADGTGFGEELVGEEVATKLVEGIVDPGIAFGGVAPEVMMGVDADGGAR